MTGALPKAERVRLMREGHAAAKAEGRRLGPLPYGQVKTTVVVDDVEQGHAIWLMVRCWRLGWSLQQIGEHLDTLKIPTPSGGTGWHKDSVRDVIHRATGGETRQRPPARRDDGGQLRIGAATG